MKYLGRELFYLPLTMAVVVLGTICIVFNLDDSRLREIFQEITRRVEGKP